MTLVRNLLLAACTLGAVVAATAGEAEIRKNLPARIPQFPAIDEVSKSPIPGVYEVRVNGSQIFYTDEQGNYLIQGNLIDVKSRKNLTEERVEKLSAVAFDQLPLKDSIKIVRGNGKRKLAVFEDPNCGYCKRFEKDAEDGRQRHRVPVPVPGARPRFEHQVARHLVQQGQEQGLGRLDGVEHPSHHRA